MDGNPPSKQGGENGDPPPERKSAAQVADRPAPAQPVDSIGVGSARTQQSEQQPFVRPYRLRTAKDTASALEFSEWFLTQKGTAIGIAIDERDVLGITNEEEGWELHHGANVIVDSTIETALHTLLTDESPFLVCGLSSETIPAFFRLAAFGPEDTDDLKRLLKRVKGDLNLLQASIGRKIEATGSFPSPADEAYTALTAELHYGASAPPFYKQVALPWMLQGIWANGREGSGTPFHISYDDLFIRILTHLTAEPTLVAAFMDELDPVAEVARVLDIDVVAVGDEQIISILFWTAVGFDALYLQQKHPRIFKHLPDGLPELEHLVERRLSGIAHWVIREREQYVNQRRLSTLYGRWLMWGLPTADALSQRLLGSVQDVLDVAEVAIASFWSEEPLLIYPVTDGMLDRTIRIRGLAPDNNRSHWLALIKGTAMLGEPPPLTQPLNPVVVWGE